MVGAKDLLSLLEKIPAWKRVSEAPSRVDELEKRVAALEEKLGDEWPADICQVCGKRALRLKRTMAHKTHIEETWHCTECSRSTKRQVRPR